MKKLVLLLTLVLLGITGFSQHSSPLVVKNFENKPNEIIDKEQIPKQNRKDSDGNNIARIRVTALGFDESLMQEFVFVPDGFEITHTVFKNGQWLLHVSSKKSGELKIKYMGDCLFRLPYQLEADKVYELTLSMETATLIIRATPDDAEIYIDNELAGTGAVTKAVSIGAEHHYKVACKDYFAKEGTVQFKERDEKEFDVELDPDFGWITVTTNPRGAFVSIDGQRVGKTPYVYEKISHGEHVVEIRKDMYTTIVRTVMINNGEVNAELENIVLSEDDGARGTVVVNSTPTGADINLNGQYKGKTPLTVENVAPGLCNLVLSMQGYQDIQKSLTVNGNDTITISETFVKIFEVSITTGDSHDKIFIDGKYVGETPFTVNLAEGSYQITGARGQCDSEDLNTLKSINTVTVTTKTLKVSQDSNKSITFVFPEGALPNVFSVAANRKVKFSKGNLQYQASSKTLRFAKHQWEYLGEQNYSISDLTSVWIDLFNWSTGTNPSNYWYDNDTYYKGFNDWGKNTISNGKGYSWRTMTRDEWVYLLYYRQTKSGYIFAKAQVNGVNGIIILPDDWKAENYKFKDVNKGNVGYTKNVISSYDWKNIFEPNGAVFLPAAGQRYNGKSLMFINERGFYWTANTGRYNIKTAVCFYFSGSPMGSINTDYDYPHGEGHSVRLVTDVTR